MRIGRPQRIIEVQPVDEPVPEVLPEPAPSEQPEPLRELVELDR
jgi:hypothetical protein